MNTKIEHWKYNDGWHYTTTLVRVDPSIAWEFGQQYVGWSCWVYPSNDADFEDYMQTLKSAEAISRFNGGDCMYTVWIRDKNDADAFSRKFNLKL
jgi:hypothetical protein